MSLRGKINLIVGAITLLFVVALLGLHFRWTQRLVRARRAHKRASAPPSPPCAR